MICLNPTLLKEGDIVYCIYQVPRHEVDTSVLARDRPDEPVLVGAWVTIVSPIEDYCGVSTRFFGVPEGNDNVMENRRLIEYSNTAALVVRRTDPTRPNRPDAIDDIDTEPELAARGALATTAAGYVNELENYVDHLAGVCAQLNATTAAAAARARQAEHIINLAGQMARALEDL